MEKEIATHSSVPAWRIPGTVEPGGLPSLGSHRVRHDWSDLAAAAVCFIFLCLKLVPKQQSFHFIYLLTTTKIDKKNVFNRQDYYMVVEIRMIIWEGWVTTGKEQKRNFWQGRNVYTLIWWWLQRFICL